MRRVLVLVGVVCALCVGRTDAQGLKFRQSTAERLQKRLSIVPESPAERLKTLRELFVSAGCTDNKIVEQAVPDSMPNLICTLPGTQTGSIVFGAAYEYESKGDEAQVKWGTVALLPALAESLTGSPRRFSLVLIAFGGRNDGVAGATHYVKQLDGKHRKSIVAMLDLDRLGRTPVGYHFPDHEITTFDETANLSEPGHVDTVLSKAIVYAADVIEAERPKEIAETPRTAAKPFFNAKIEALALHSPAYIVLHRPDLRKVKQSRTVLDPKSYYDSYQLLCVYALVLDAGMPAPAK